MFDIGVAELLWLYTIPAWGGNPPGVVGIWNGFTDSLKDELTLPLIWFLSKFCYGACTKALLFTA